MNRILLKGLPMAESALYRRRPNVNRRALTLACLPKRNIPTRQSGYKNAATIKETPPVSYETFSTSTVAHQATRKRFLRVCESELA